ncbi:MAG: dehydrogenase, partial [Bacteroidota bacterium]|nr:dehydrogenase [Bacteroidota bacterium]
MKINLAYRLPRLLMCLLLVLLGVTAIQCKQKKSAVATGGIPQEKALSTFELEPGFKIELVAAEPLVADPVAMEIDENGRMYVVEMHGYPLDKSGTGKIKLLTDTNGDGRMEKSTTFAEGLMLPTGIIRWKKGVLVTDPPSV